MTTNTLNLYAGGERLLKCAWSAMDQTYFDQLIVGEALSSPDNAAEPEPGSTCPPGRQMGWAIPDSGFVVSGIFSNGANGKIVIYKNVTTHELIVSVMGTDGNSDSIGWMSNFKDRGRSRSRTKGATRMGTRDTAKPVGRAQGWFVRSTRSSRRGVLPMVVSAGGVTIPT